MEGRSIPQVLRTLPDRLSQRSRLEDMNDEEKDLAHISNEVYEPASHRTSFLRGYTLLQDVMTLDGATVPLNDTRWAVYRAPNDLDHVLAFRGTADREDLRHNADLMLSGFGGEHKYTMAAAVWAARVMLFLSARHNKKKRMWHNNKPRLKFQVTGHSLGGAVAMGVVILLFDISAVARRLESVDSQSSKRNADWFTFRRDVVEPWTNTATKTSSRGSVTTPYVLCGGHIFNPASLPRLHLHTSGSRGLISEIMGDSATVDHGDAERVDKRVTAHCIIGDVISCTFRMGAVKSYAPSRGSRWRPHSMANFM